MWIAIGIISYILFWLCCIVSYAVYYLTNVIQVSSFSQVIYTMNAGTEGAEGTIGEAIGGFFASRWLILLLGTLLFAAFIYWAVQRRKNPDFSFPFMNHKDSNLVYCCSTIGISTIVTAALVFQLVNGYNVLRIGDYLKSIGKDSEIYEEYYVKPEETTIIFPEKKRNLVYIVMESMEVSYADPEHGGAYEENLIPNLTALAEEEGVNFNSTDSGNLLNGAYVADNSAWTVAGLVAQSAGIPLNVGNSYFCRSFQADDPFMPNITSLGQILEAEGYHNYFLCGSDAAYAGRSNYYKQHGNYEITDLFAAREKGYIPKDYSVWWGFEDKKLYSIAEEQLTDIAKNDQPFNYTMLTADTHFADGYLCEDCPDTFDTQYKNVIACSDKKVTEFIRWIQQQDFYKDTTIVIAGDHCSMDASVPLNTGADYQRKSFFTVINGPEYKQKSKRDYTTMDIFPTILEALGAKIEGSRLALGTSLYSNESTLVELMGMAELNIELNANSEFYDDYILSGDSSNYKAQEQQPAPAEEGPGEVAVVAPTAQIYMQNQDQFANPDYVYNPNDYNYNDSYIGDYNYYPDYGYQEPVVTPTDPGTSGGEVPGTDHGTGEGSGTGTEGGTTGGGTGTEGGDPGSSGGTTGGGTGTEGGDPGSSGGTTGSGTGTEGGDPGSTGGTTGGGTGSEGTPTGNNTGTEGGTPAASGTETNQ